MSLWGAQVSGLVSADTPGRKARNPCGSTSGELDEDAAKSTDAELGQSQQD